MKTIALAIRLITNPIVGKPPIEEVTARLAPEVKDGVVEAPWAHAEDGLQVVTRSPDIIARLKAAEIGGATVGEVLLGQQ